MSRPVDNGNQSTSDDRLEVTQWCPPVREVFPEGVTVTWSLEERGVKETDVYKGIRYRSVSRKTQVGSQV